MALSEISTLTLSGSIILLDFFFWGKEAEDMERIQGWGFWLGETKAEGRKKRSFWDFKLSLQSDTDNGN